MMLTARDLARRVRGRALLAGVTLDIRPAEMLGLIGPNGSGKSTLLRMLAGLVRPDGGQVALDGKPLRAMPARQVARHIALVAQSAETSDRITVRDAVALGRTPWLDALRPWSPADEAHVAQALAAAFRNAIDVAWMAKDLQETARKLEASAKPHNVELSGHQRPARKDEDGTK